MLRCIFLCKIPKPQDECLNDHQPTSPKCQQMSNVWIDPDKMLEQNETVQFFTRRTTQNWRIREQNGAKTSCQQTRWLELKSPRARNRESGFMAAQLQDACSVRVVIRAKQKVSAQRQNCTLSNGSLHLHKTIRDTDGHAKSRRRVIRALRRHTRIGIQRCCGNEMQLALAIDTHNFSTKNQARTIHVYTTCAPWTVNIYQYHFIQICRVENHE